MNITYTTKQGKKFESVKDVEKYQKEREEEEKRIREEFEQRRNTLEYDCMGHERRSPCESCTIKDGYGGEFRCSCCELNFLKREYERLIKQVDKLKKQIKKGE